MNQHTCPTCGRRFYCRAMIGDVDKIPKHDDPTRGFRCAGTGAKATATFPPGATVGHAEDYERARTTPRYRTNLEKENTP